MTRVLVQICRLLLYEGLKCLIAYALLASCGKLYNEHKAFGGEVNTRNQKFTMIGMNLMISMIK